MREVKKDSSMTDRPLVLVVGANRGIGLGVTQTFLARGWDVIATARAPDSAEALRRLATTEPSRLEIRALDMSGGPGIDAFATSVADRTFDAVLINAGVAGPAHRSANSATPEETGALMFVNAIAPIRLGRLLLNNIKADSGVLAYTSSIMGSVALNAGGHELYRASKAALNSLSRGLFAEMRGRNLTLLTLHPGWVRTDMGGSGAPVGVEESAGGMVDVIAKSAGSRRHAFLDYQGKELAW
jgi:NAD(P)-dependent dehydrogenase (short-subunit alcohol dehydrogenase family)